MAAEELKRPEPPEAVENPLVSFACFQPAGPQRLTVLHACDTSSSPRWRKA